MDKAKQEELRHFVGQKNKALRFSFLLSLAVSIGFALLFHYSKNSYLNPLLIFIFVFAFACIRYCWFVFWRNKQVHQGVFTAEKFDRLCADARLIDHRLFNKYAIVCYLLLTATCSAFAVQNHLRETDLLEHGRLTKGQVLDIDFHRSSREALVVYRVDGKEWETKFWVAKNNVDDVKHYFYMLDDSLMSADRGAWVWVLYSSKDPSNSEVITDNWR